MRTNNMNQPSPSCALCLFLALLSMASCSSDPDKSPSGQEQLERDAGSNNASQSESNGARDLADVEGLRLCCLLGAGCHPGSDDPPGGTVRLCHELGHANVPGDCREQYEQCLAACNPSGEETEHACF